VGTTLLLNKGLNTGEMTVIQTPLTCREEEVGPRLGPRWHHQTRGARHRHLALVLLPVVQPLHDALRRLPLREGRVLLHVAAQVLVVRAQFARAPQVGELEVVGGKDPPAHGAREALQADQVVGAAAPAGRRTRVVIRLTGCGVRSKLFLFSARESKREACWKIILCHLDGCKDPSEHQARKALQEDPKAATRLR
jgi:hypothetical protein